MIFIGNRNNQFMASGIIALLGILLSFLLPELFNWYRMEYIENGDFVYGVYLTGIGILVSKGAVPSIFIITVFELIGGLLVFLGSIAIIISGLRLSKKIGRIGGILILLGPILFIIDLLIGINEFARITESLGPDVHLMGTIFLGSASYDEITLSWSIGLGFFICLGSGILEFIILSRSE